MISEVIWWMQVFEPEGKYTKYWRHLNMSKFYSTWLKRSKYISDGCPCYRGRKAVAWGFVPYLFCICPTSLECTGASSSSNFFSRSWNANGLHRFWRSHWSGSRDTNVISIRVRLSSYGRVTRGQRSVLFSQRPTWQIGLFAWSTSACMKPNTLRCPPSPTLSGSRMAPVTKGELTCQGIFLCS